MGAKNRNLIKAKIEKDDEFYTQYDDIKKEIQTYLDYNPDLFRDKVVLCPCDDPELSNFSQFFIRNFNKLGLKKLICSCYNSDSEFKKPGTVRSLLDDDFDEAGSENLNTKGRVLIVDRVSIKESNDKLLNSIQLLEDSGDFRSQEITKFRDEADFIITNPPFSLFSEFINWILDRDTVSTVSTVSSPASSALSAQQKQFAIIGNMNAICYGSVFPRIRDNEIWLGVHNGAKSYMRPDNSIQKLGNTFWFTNIDYGSRHQPLSLMTMKENIERSRHKDVREHNYFHYENYDAIEVSHVDAIPSDYKGKMGVPLTFLSKYCPEQFEIVGLSCIGDFLPGAKPIGKDWIELYHQYGGKGHITENSKTLVSRDESGKPIHFYIRLVIRHK